MTLVVHDPETDKVRSKLQRRVLLVYVSPSNARSLMNRQVVGCICIYASQHL
jgi:hypothetical protein